MSYKPNTTLILKNKILNEFTDRKRQKSIEKRECRVCGAPAVYSYFGCISCNPCKMFFKRNARSGMETLKCNYGGHCEVNVNNRHVCSYCRLQKCLESGMQIEMLRSSYSKRTRPNKKKQKEDLVIATSTDICQLKESQQFPTLNLLQNDVSTLTVEQWNLLSNLTHCYDEHSGLELGQRFMNTQNNLPVKYRFKTPAMVDYFIASMGLSQTLYQNNQDFLSITSYDRSILLNNSVKHTVCLSENLIFYIIGLLDNPVFFHTIATISNENVAECNRKVAERIRIDPTITKLLLAIVLFSTINYTTYTNPSKKVLSNLKQVLDIQNRYIEITWRYLLYRCGYRQAVIIVSDLVRCLFSVTDSIHYTDDLQFFNDTVDSIVEHTEQSLNIMD